MRNEHVNDQLLYFIIFYNVILSNVNHTSSGKKINSRFDRCRSGITLRRIRSAASDHSYQCVTCERATKMGRTMNCLLNYNKTKVARNVLTMTCYKKEKKKIRNETNNISENSRRDARNYDTIFKECIIHIVAFERNGMNY